MLGATEYVLIAAAGALVLLSIIIVVGALLAKHRDE